MPVFVLVSLVALEVHVAHHNALTSPRTNKRDVTERTDVEAVRSSPACGFLNSTNPAPSSTLLKGSELLMLGSTRQQQASTEVFS